MKDLRAERSIRKQLRVIYEMAPRAKTPLGRGRYSQERLLPAQGVSFQQLRVTRPPEDAQLTLAHKLGCRAALTPYVQFSIKPAQSWFLGAFSFQSSMEKMEKELSLNPPCPQTPAHTHTHVQLSAVGICKAQVWFGGCCDGSEDSCSQWADPMTKRKKRRQTQVFNKTFINDFPGRTLALAQRVQQSRDCSELEKFILSTKHCKEQPSKAQYFPSTRRNNWAAGFWNFTALLHIGIFLRHHSHTKTIWMDSGTISTAPRRAVHCSSRCTQKGHWLIQKL